MPAEAGIRQRAIVGRRLAFADSELVTKYTLPFVDATWKVPFVVFDLLGSPPKVLSGPVHLEGSRLRSQEPRAALRRIEDLPVSDFATLAHYDPWWAFRGVSGVDRGWIPAIFATNIARPFVHEGKRLKIDDLRFADGMDRLDALIAKDELFRTIEFHPGDIDLLQLRTNLHVAPTGRDISPTAKVL